MKYCHLDEKKQNLNLKCEFPAKMSFASEYRRRTQRNKVVYNHHLITLMDKRKGVPKITHQS
jgi:hypothetical protein